jgi:hypothetical protein
VPSWIYTKTDLQAVALILLTSKWEKLTLQHAGMLSTYRDIFLSLCRLHFMILSCKQNLYQRIDGIQAIDLTKVTDMNDSGRVLDASAHLLSRALMSQSASESWCIKYSVTSSVKQTPFVYLSTVN